MPNSYHEVPESGKGGSRKRNDGGLETAAPWANDRAGSRPTLLRQPPSQELRRTGSLGNDLPLYLDPLVAGAGIGDGLDDARHLE
jgi:hypothetical protein